MLWYFRIPSTSGYIKGAPVCASYCNRWFDACKDDYTCVENWLEDFDYALDGANSCPANSSCMTFRDMYGNGEGLCNRMWGEAFVYSEDESNCTVMVFNSSSSNPNYRLSFPSGDSSACAIQSSIMILGLMLMLFISIVFWLFVLATTYSCLCPAILNQDHSSFFFFFFGIVCKLFICIFVIYNIISVSEAAIQSCQCTVGSKACSCRQHNKKSVKQFVFFLYLKNFHKIIT